MALNSNNVVVALSGAIYWAPAGTAGPTDAEAAWGAGWVDLGYASEDGITETPDDDTTDIPAWQNGDTVRTLINSSRMRYGFTLIETTERGLELYYRTTVTDAGTGTASLEIGTPSTARFAFGFDVIDGDGIIRTVIDEGDVTERGEITYSNTEAVGYDMTVTAFPVDGVSVRKMYTTPAFADVTP